MIVWLDDYEAQVGGLKELEAKTPPEANALLPSVLDKAQKGEL